MKFYELNRGQEFLLMKSPEDGVFASAGVDGSQGRCVPADKEWTDKEAWIYCSPLTEVRLVTQDTIGDVIADKFKHLYTHQNMLDDIALNYDPRLIFPVPDDEEDQAISGLKAGPAMSGNVMPFVDGRYLRFFEDENDWAFSELVDGKWTTDGFWGSDIVDAPWRGGIAK